MINIVIPAYQLHDYTTLCIQTIQRCTKVPWEIILIDNGSNPPYGQYYPDERIQVIRNSENLGFPKAVNQGWKASNGEAVCFLNNDIIVTPGWLERLSAHLEQVDIVGPTTNYSCGMQCINLPTIYESQDELDQMAGQFCQNNEGWLKRVRWLSGFCLLVRRRVLEDVGGFNEIYGMGNYEDLDLCLTAGKLGYGIGLAYDVYVHHFGSMTHAAIRLSVQEQGCKNYPIFAERWEDGHIQEIKEEE